MGVATTVRDATNIERANENETRREMIASWYITMPGIPSSEKEQLEKSLRYNLWASLIRFIVLNFVLTCVWFFGFGLGFDAIKAATGQQLKGTMTVTGVVQEDGLTLSVKDPNKGKHVVYSLTDLGVDPTGWSYGGRLNTYWSKDEDSGDYSIIAVIPEKEASRIQGLEDAILMTGYFSIIVIGLLIFFVRRRKYTSWYIPFYWRMEKFCSENQIYQMYPGYNTEEAFIAYGNEHADTFSRQFAATQLTEMEKKKKKRHRMYEGEKIASFTDLNIGDYVVHENHGLGIYRGIEKIEVDKTVKDYIKIEYAGGGNLYILATQLELIQKYAGADAKKPKLNKLGGQEWNKTKTKVRGAVKEIAGDLVRLYAVRQSERGFACLAARV